MHDTAGKLRRLFKENQPLPASAVELLVGESARDSLLGAGQEADLLGLAEDTQICNCNEVPKGRIVADIKASKCTLAALGEANRAGTGCGTCQPLLNQLIDIYAPASRAKAKQVNKVELVKQELMK